MSAPTDLGALERRILLDRIADLEALASARLQDVASAEGRCAEQAVRIRDLERELVDTQFALHASEQARLCAEDAAGPTARSFASALDKHEADSAIVGAVSTLRAAYGALYQRSRAIARECTYWADRLDTMTERM